MNYFEMSVMIQMAYQKDEKRQKVSFLSGKVVFQNNICNDEQYQ
jgi:hypothetical protein